MKYATNYPEAFSDSADDGQRADPHPQATDWTVTVRATERRSIPHASFVVVRQGSCSCGSLRGKLARSNTG
jgi:hypothetical protein